MKNDFRQFLHLEPQKGWLNDPNGLSFFKGEYHVYFQYSPDSAFGKGDKCWGHWCGDLLRMKFTGAVLRPDTPYDRDGVYSGCSFVKGDTLYLFYTGNVKEKGDHDYITSGRGANVILVTTKDGHHMSEKKVLLTNNDYPEWCSCHVRDPKVWEENGKYRMVLGARTLDDRGCVLFYESDDLENWQLSGNDSLAGFGYMWECPDVFTIGRYKYLSVSPQGLPHEEYHFQNVYSSGHFIYGDAAFEDYEEWDYGFDFYAPQTFEAPDGRRILIGWMGIGDIPYKNPTAEMGWQHCLTIPRTLTGDDNGRILQNPIREFEQLRTEKRDFSKGDIITTELSFELYSAAHENFALFFDFLTMRYADGIFTIEFTDEEVSGGRTKRSVKLSQCADIRIIADTSSLEIYLNGGEKVLSTRFYPYDTVITIRTENISGTIYTLKGTEVISDVS